MITLDSSLKAKASRLTIDGLKNEGEVCVCGGGISSKSAKIHSEFQLSILIIFLLL